jgi:hypothetical protein
MTTKRRPKSLHCRTESAATSHSAQSEACAARQVRPPPCSHPIHRGPERKPAMRRWVPGCSKGLWGRWATANRWAVGEFGSRWPASCSRQVVAGHRAAEDLTAAALPRRPRSHPGFSEPSGLARTLLDTAHHARHAIRCSASLARPMGAFRRSPATKVVAHEPRSFAWGKVLKAGGTDGVVRSRSGFVQSRTRAQGRIA